MCMCMYTYTYMRKVLCVCVCERMYFVYIRVYISTLFAVELI